jgi:hypothetical protein
MERYHEGRSAELQGFYFASSPICYAEIKFYSSVSVESEPTQLKEGRYLHQHEYYVH